jgi:hypothetical protein
MYALGGGAIFPCTNDTRMVTTPCPSLADVLRQKQRWARGGTATGIKGYTVLAIAGLMMLAIVIAPFVSVPMWIAVWTTKFVADALLMLPNIRRLGMTDTMRYFLPFEFYFIVQALVIPILLMNKTVVWKGREYRS